MAHSRSCRSAPAGYSGNHEVRRWLILRSANQRQMVYWRLLSTSVAWARQARRWKPWPRPWPRGSSCRPRSSTPRSASTFCCIAIPKLVPHFEAVQRCIDAPEESASDRSTGGAPLPSRPRMGKATSVGPLPSRSCCSTYSGRIRAPLVHRGAVQPVVSGRGRVRAVHGSGTGLVSHGGRRSPPRRRHTGRGFRDERPGLRSGR